MHPHYAGEIWKLTNHCGRKALVHPLSPHFSRGQNAENPVSSLFTPRKRLLRRLDNNKLHIRPVTHAVYAASLKIEGILFQEFPT